MVAAVQVTQFHQMNTHTQLGQDRKVTIHKVSISATVLYICRQKEEGIHIWSNNFTALARIADRCHPFLGAGLSLSMGRQLGTSSYKGDIKGAHGHKGTVKFTFCFCLSVCLSAGWATHITSCFKTAMVYGYLGCHLLAKHAMASRVWFHSKRLMEC